jgi:hypothetical protein
VTVIDRVLAVAEQAWHLLNFATGIEHLHEVGVDQHIDLLPDQTARHRIRVTLDLDRAATANADAGDPLPMIQSVRRQLAKTRLFLGELGLARRVTFVNHSLQKPFVLLAASEVTTATHQQGLVHDGLEMTMRRFHVTVLVRLADVDALRLHLVVIHQIAVSRAELTIFRKIVDRGTQAVAAVLAGHAAQLPKRLLQSTTEGLERLGETDRGRLPI